MWKTSIQSVLFYFVLTIITGLIYPLIVTGIGLTCFPVQAKGALIELNGSIIGSKLIGQTFTSNIYFHGRPSAAGDSGYDSTSSSGSNLGPTSTNLIETVTQNLISVRQENNLPINASIPSNLVTASASGLDPDITPDAAYMQIERIAHARNLPNAAIKQIVDALLIPSQFGVLGQPRINVLELNTALDQAQSSLAK